MHANDFSGRLRLCIADEPVAAFARRCGISEGLIRSYLKAEKQPGMERLIRIADAAGVSLEWLATGRGPMRREAASQAASQGVPGSALKGVLRENHARRLEKIGQLLAGMDEKEAAAFLDEMFARAQTAAEAAELRRVLKDLRAEVERLKKRA